MSESKSEKAERSPLSAFFHHQKTAVEETGKALGSLLPKEFRKHTGKALEEGRAGFEALFDGVIDSVECGLNKLRRSSAESDEGKNKVKVDVD